MARWGLRRRSRHVPLAPDSRRRPPGYHHRRAPPASRRSPDTSRETAAGYAANRRLLNHRRRCIAMLTAERTPPGSTTTTLRSAAPAELGCGVDERVVLAAAATLDSGRQAARAVVDGAPLVCASPAPRGWIGVEGVKCEHVPRCRQSDAERRASDAGGPASRRQGTQLLFRRRSELTSGRCAAARRASLPGRRVTFSRGGGTSRHITRRITPAAGTHAISRRRLRRSG